MKGRGFIRSRRTDALERLQDQLKEGKKTQKGGFNKIPLTDGDVKRIEREIKMLETRV